ncbi:hypothetical protein BC828DRAFT_405892 [Blastocladiella britannica]|nr:hypothetical protein BC828DRAFT_405892 [Blastocladiella britannica]
MYLRSIGIVPIFLPAYCPFFNPIEVFFAIVKARMRRIYQENTLTAKTLPIKVAEIMFLFRHMNMSRLYAKCGYEFAGRFDLRAYKTEVLEDDEEAQDTV